MSDEANDFDDSEVIDVVSKDVIDHFEKTQIIKMHKNNAGEKEIKMRVEKRNKT